MDQPLVAPIHAASAQAMPHLPLSVIAPAYLRVGATAFGFAILQQLKSVALGRGWLTDEEFSEGLALVQMYPGPIMVDLTAYVGYALRGVPGAVVATSCFILPSFILMLALSARCSFTPKRKDNPSPDQVQGEYTRLFVSSYGYLPNNMWTATRLTVGADLMHG